MVDRYSGYPFVQCLPSTLAAPVTQALAGWWELFGFPSFIWGGPQFRCQEFLAFCNEKDIDLETSSLYNLRSHGLAEAAIKNCKKLLLKCISWGENMQTPCSSFVNALAQTGSRRRSSCLVGACSRLSQRRRERSSRSPLGQRRKRRRKQTALAEIGNCRLEKIPQGG